MMNFNSILWLVSTLSGHLCLATKKHVVLIVADDLGWNDISFHGSDEYLTPNIDALAYSGIILQNYYVMSVCTPSRSALMSGIHPIYTGLYHHYIHSGQPTGLPLDVKILPQYLKEYGYKTHAVGKWHLGYCKEEYTPIKRGFDSHFGYWNGRIDYFSHRISGGFVNGLDLRRNDNISYGYDGQYATDLFTQESVNIINAHNPSEPLFLYLAHLAVHAPVQAPREVINKFRYIKDKPRRIYAAMMYKLDESVGQVTQALARKGMLDDTIIIFTTDNGGVSRGNGHSAGSNWPLKGLKDSAWEGGVRGVSFIWSSDLPHSKVNHALMHIQDWLPTILGAIDENINENPAIQKLDGHNMWPVITGEREFEYDEILLQHDHLRGTAALRKENWKLIQGTTRGGLYDNWYGPSGRNGYSTYNIDAIKRSRVATILQNNFSFPLDYEIMQIRNNVSFNCDYCQGNDTNCIPCNLQQNACLFDIATDPCEKNNLASKYPHVLKDMFKILECYVPVPALYPRVDDRANPIFWNYTWINWLDYVDENFQTSNQATSLLSKKTLTKLLKSVQKV